MARLKNPYGVKIWGQKPVAIACKMCGETLPKHASTCAYTEFKTVLPEAPVITSPPRTEAEQEKLKVKWNIATFANDMSFNYNYVDEEWTTSIANDFARRIDEDVMTRLANALDDSWCA